MSVTVGLHGHLSWYTEQRRARVELPVRPGTPVREIMELLNVPRAEVHLVAINGRQVSVEDTVSDGDTVDLFPVIAGG